MVMLIIVLQQSQYLYKIHSNALPFEYVVSSGNENLWTKKLLNNLRITALKFCSFTNYSLNVYFCKYNHQNIKVYGIQAKLQNFNHFSSRSLD